ncbi:pirin-like isoform X2 [Ostrea edulis]|uniref:pirin-like isoform X2 n=1 Tax=Ostrea edulis TaxID=37623 RepID=UPI0024AECC4F|nr:pirin-like isoform X2 [Ostrea edulis]
MLNRYSLVTYTLSAIVGNLKVTSKTPISRTCQLLDPFRFTTQTCGIKTRTVDAMKAKTVFKAVLSVEQDEGVGARVRRSVGRPELKNFDPFLMLDEFKDKAPGGFPDHPHRGFETVTYVLKGKMRHEDFCGHKGTIGPGDLQWMTAGRGIVHCEMPHGDEEVHGLQLWVNLAKKYKMIEPAYQELLSKDIPSVTKDGVTVKVIAGEAFGIKSKVYTRTPTMYLDFKLDPGSKLEQPIPAGWRSFLYTLSGKAKFGPSGNQKEFEAHHTVTFNDDGDSIFVENTGSTECHFVMIAGEPIKEPIFQHGPFVMNTQDEIQQTFYDYRSGKNGFENAPKWKSDYVKNRK